MKKGRFISSKRIVSSLISLTLALSLAPNIFGSSDTYQNSSELPSFVEYLIEEEQMGDVIATHELLSSDENIVAYCLDFENGYLIYDINGEVVEYCEDSKSPLDGLTQDVYFTGPFSYYTESDGIYTNSLSGEVINYDDLSDQSSNMAEILDVESKMLEEIDNDDIIVSEEIGNVGTSISPMGVKTTTTQEGEYTRVKEALTDKPRCFDYYTDKSCGAVAVTTLLFYYNDYINSNILKTTYSSNPRSLYDYLLNNHIPLNASYSQIQSGLTTAFPKISNDTYRVNIVDGTRDSNAAVGQTWGNYKYLLKTRAIPAILLLQEHPSYGNHWVVSYGVIAYYTSSGKFHKRQYVVNNGFQKNDVKIGCSYVDGFIYLS